MRNQRKPEARKTRGVASDGQFAAKPAADAADRRRAVAEAGRGVSGKSIKPSAGATARKRRTPFVL